MADALRALQQWYFSQCDGDWEHSEGIRIDTLDNPGWSLHINLRDTPLSNRPFDPVIRLEHPTEWLHCKRTNSHFEGHGGPLMLGEIIHVFLSWAHSSSA